MGTSDLVRMIEAFPFDLSISLSIISSTRIEPSNIASLPSRSSSESPPAAMMTTLCPPSILRGRMKFVSGSL